MQTLILNTCDLKAVAPTIRCGDKIILSGVVYTARDAAHKRIFEMLDLNQKLPFDLNGATIYYAGPTQAPDNLPIGSCGPTTSSRMDRFTPRLLDLGLSCMIGKGQRNEQVCEAIKRNKAVYLCAIGGAGALAASCIKKCDVIAFDDLGCESIKRLEIKDFPLIAAIDCVGSNIFTR